ncbi:MAG: DNA cytosine methyltransferase [Thermoplasmata archaeon]
MSELAVDYCCGVGGWSDGFADAGFDVLGFDVKPQPKYRHEFVRADIRDLNGGDLPRVPRVVVGSAPCQPFTQYNQFTRDPEKGMELVRELYRLWQESRAPLFAFENVRLSVRYIEREFGPPTLNANPYFIWTNAPMGLRLRSNHEYKGLLREPKQITFKRGPSAGVTKTVRRWGWKGADEAARIPYAIARPLAEACLSEGGP